MEQAIVTRLDNMRQEGGESLKSNFTRFSVKLIVCELFQMRRLGMPYETNYLWKLSSSGMFSTKSSLLPLASKFDSK